MCRRRQTVDAVAGTAHRLLRRALCSRLTEELGCLALLVAAVVSLTDAGQWVFKLDSYVYYAAVEQWQDGGDLYRWFANPAQDLWPFTYTPLAAWLLTPLTWLTYEWATALLVLATPVCAAVTAWAVLRALHGRADQAVPALPPDQPPAPSLDCQALPQNSAPPAWPRGWPDEPASGPTLCAQGLRSLAPWLALAALMVLEPFPKTMEYGQVNAILMALVALDVLVVPERSRWRGVLSGTAAAVKLTPAVAVLVFLAGRQWRAAATMVGSAAGLTLLAALLSPRETWDFFTWAMWDTGRAGFTDYSGNQNIMGAVARSLPEDLQAPVWALCAALVVAAAWTLCRRLDALAPTGPPRAGVPDAATRAGSGTAGEPGTQSPQAAPPHGAASAAGAGRGLVLVLQMSVVMVTGLLVSPISWSHHWVWVLPALMALASAAWRWRSPTLVGAAVAGVLVFLLAVHWQFPEQNHVEQGWSAWQKLLGSSYTWWALGSGAALWLASGQVRRDRARQVEPVTA